MGEFTNRISRMRRASQFKTFGELTDADSVWFPNPFVADKVDARKIKEIKGASPEDYALMKSLVKVAPNKALQVICFRDEVILHSPDIEQIPTVKYLVDADSQSMITMQKVEGIPNPLPIPIFASKALLERWMLQGQTPKLRKLF